MKILSTIAAILLSISAVAQTEEINLLFAGDIMGHDSQIAAAFNDSTKTYSYAECFEHVKPFVEQADLAIANFEVTMAGQPFKGYPQFSSPDQLAIDVQNCGFDVLVTANNHSCDRGRKGIERTIRVLDSLNIAHTGTFCDSTEYNSNYPLVVEVKGMRFAILNYTYGTNGIAVPNGNIVNMIDTKQIATDVAAARSKSDMIIACMHWGDEYVTTPTSNEIQLASMLKKLGVELIIGSHPHVLQPIELDTVSNQLTVYSLGNFVSGQRTAPRDGAMMVNVKLTPQPNGKPRISANYRLTYVHYPTINGKRHFIVVPVAAAESGLLQPINSTNWGRLYEFATEARSIMSNNVCVDEVK